MERAFSVPGLLFVTSSAHNLRGQGLLGAVEGLEEVQDRVVLLASPIGGSSALTGAVRSRMGSSRGENQHRQI